MHDFGIRREQCFLESMHFAHGPPRRPFPSSSTITTTNDNDNNTHDDIDHLHFLTRTPEAMVSYHDFNSHKYNLRVSNPRANAYVHFHLPSESSNLRGAGPVFPD